MRALKNPKAAVAITVALVLVSLIFGTIRSVRAEADRVAAMFVRGVDDNGYGINGDLDERVDYANQLMKVAQKYDGLDAELGDVSDAVLAMLEDRTPAARYRADMDLENAVTGLNLAMQDVSLSEKDEEYRSNIMAAFESPAYKIEKEAIRYNEQVDHYEREVLGGLVARFVETIINLPQVEAYR